MSMDVFRLLCDQLGYDPKRVLSVRLNARQVVVVTRSESGELCVTNYEHTDAGLLRVSQGQIVAGRRRGV